MVDHRMEEALVNLQEKMYETPSGTIRNWVSAADKSAPCLVFLPEEQCAREREVAEREGYEIEVVQGDMTKPLPFADDSFDLIFHPVSNVYVRDVAPVFREAARVLKPGGRMLSGLDMGVSFAFDDDGAFEFVLPFDPVANPAHRQACEEGGWGFQFSHTVADQIGGQLHAGLVLRDLYDDYDREGPFYEHRLPTFMATWSEKPVRSCTAGPRTTAS